MSAYTCRDLYFCLLGTHSNSAKAAKIKMREARLEKYIKDYVYDKTGESVYLHLEDAIMISHITKRGSITLAILWANILQHPNNFPPEVYHYNKFYDSPTGGDRLVLKAEGVIFTVFMASGSLVMEGKYIYDWFVKRFKELLDNYDETFQNTWTFIPTPSLSVNDIDCEPDRYEPDTEAEKYLLLMTRRHKEDTPLDRKMAECRDDLIPGLGNMNIDQTLFEADDLQSELDSLRSGAIKEGLSYIYKLWKSLLNKWFSDSDTKVYIATPELDTIRLQDIVDFNIVHQYKGSLEVLYTNANCDCHNANSVEQVKKSVLKKYDGKHQTYIEYKILNRIMLPMSKVNACFIAAVKDDSVQVLITSAAFHGRHFLYDIVGTVLFLTLDKDAFLKKYIDPIATPVVASMY